MNTLTYLKAQVDSVFATNGTKNITAIIVRPFLKNFVDGLFTPAGTVRIWPGVTLPTGWSKCDGSAMSITDYADLYAALGGPSSPYGVGATTFNIPMIQPSQTVIQKGIAAIQIQWQGNEYQMGETLTAAAPVGGVEATFKVIGVGQAFNLQIISSGEGFVSGTQITLTGGTGSGCDILITSAYKLGSTGGEINHLLTVPEMPSHSHQQIPHSHVVQHAIQGGSSSIGAIGATGSSVTPVLDSKILTGSTAAENYNNGGGLSHNNMSPYVAMNYIIKLY
jgi:microcystin-dependent protein